MAYSNNHYVPQFILRRFGTKINRYNIGTKEFKIKVSTKNSFSDMNIYPEWLEKLFGKIESNVAKLIDKILKSSTILTLTRGENWLIKKFFAIEMLRAPDSYLSSKRNIDDIERMKSEGFKEVTKTNESNSDYTYRTIKVLIESNSIEEVYNHKDVTYEACKWITLFNNCYLSIWDSKKSGEDFLIIDNGMICEHDRTRFFTFHNLCGKGLYTNYNDELLKNGYILKSLHDTYKSSKIAENSIYMNIFHKMKYVHANYYYFSISSTRTISLINPFYRLYFDKNLLDIIKKEPDIWPTLLSKHAMCSNTQSYSTIGVYSSNDKFNYMIKDLQLEDVIRINCMSLDRVNKWLGFDESSKIVRSLNVYSMIPKNIKRKDYSPLIEKLINLGYEFSNNLKHKKIIEEFVKVSFNEKDLEYIEFFYNSIQHS